MNSIKQAAAGAVAFFVSTGFRHRVASVAAPAAVVIIDKVQEQVSGVSASGQNTVIIIMAVEAALAYFRTKLAA